MLANLDTLVTALYVRVEISCPARRGPGRPPRISDAELIALAVAQIVLGIPNDRKFLALARRRLGHLFPICPSSPATTSACGSWPRRSRGSSATSPSAAVVLRQPAPARLAPRCRAAQSRETARRASWPDFAGYGWCKSHSRYFWGFSLYLLCAPDGMPICFELAPANAPERASRPRCSARRPGRLHRHGRQGLCRGRVRAAHGRPWGRTSSPRPRGGAGRHGSLGAVRQWIESVIWTCKGQLHPEAPWRPHPRGRLHPRRPAPARPRRRPPPQPDIGEPGPPLRRLRPLITESTI